jgi:hypothetical protein
MLKFLSLLLLCGAAHAASTETWLLTLDRWGNRSYQTLTLERRKARRCTAPSAATELTGKRHGDQRGVQRRRCQTRPATCIAAESPRGDSCAAPPTSRIPTNRPPAPQHVVHRAPACLSAPTGPPRRHRIHADRLRQRVQRAPRAGPHHLARRHRAHQAPSIPAASTRRASRARSTAIRRPGPFLRRRRRAGRHPGGASAPRAPEPRLRRQPRHHRRPRA